MIGLLNSGAGGDPNAPTAPWGRDDSLGQDPVSARGNMWGAEIGDSFGAGGLGLSGLGEGGGGRGEGLGLGNIGGLGHGAGTGTGQGFGSGHGRLGGAHRSQPPQVRMGAVTVSGGLPPEVIQRIVRQNFGRFRLCYENGLRSNPNLQGRVATRFLIGTDGNVGTVSNGGSDMPDGNVVRCVARAFPSLSFPQPEGGTVSVVAPIFFSPGGGSEPDGNEAELPRPAAPAKAPAPALAKSAAFAAKSQVTVIVAEVPHYARRCGDAASVPFEDRITLWRERLERFRTNPSSVASMYQKALAACEAPTWRERSRLIALMLDALVPIQHKVDLWRALVGDVSAADAIYRGILARVRTSDDLRKLHDALGLKSMDPAELAKVIKSAKTSEERASKLRALALQWPDDFTLAMRLLDALEDIGDDAGARASAGPCARAPTPTPRCGPRWASSTSASPRAGKTPRRRPPTTPKRAAPSARSSSSLPTIPSRAAASAISSAPTAGSRTPRASTRRWPASPPTTAAWPSSSPPPPRARASSRPQ